MSIHGARNIYLEKICEYMDDGEDVFIVSADLGAPCLDHFRIKYPQRFVNVGIAEQNMVVVSAGLALQGKKVIAYTSNPFPVLRAFDQIRNTVSLMNVPLTIVGVGTGFSIPEYGATHFTIEDINILKTCPNLEIINISDNVMAKEMACRTILEKRPFYVRFDKMIGEELKMKDNIIDWSKGLRIFNEGNDGVLFTTGNTVLEILPLINKLELNNIFLTLVDVFKFPILGSEIAKILKNKKFAITLEELNLQGGLGSSILEVMADYECFLPTKRFGLDMTKGFPNEYGSREYLKKGYGLDLVDIENEILRFIERKKYV